MPKDPSLIAKITPPPLVISIGLVATVVSGAAIFSYWKFEKQKDLVDFAVKAFGFGTAITSAFYVGKNIKLNIDDRKVERSLTYISRWTDPLFAEVRQSMREIGKILDSELNEKKHPELVRQYLSDPKNEKVEEEIITISNFLEEIAIAVDKELVDEEILQDYFTVIFKRIFFSIEPWIRERRHKKKGSAIFSEFEKLAKKWNPEWDK